MVEARQWNDSTEIIKLGRVLDNNNAHEVMQAVNNALAAGRKFVLCDMTLVEFLSSSGVGSLISSLSLLRKNGGNFTLFNLSEKMTHVLDALDLLDYIPIEADFAKASARLH